MISLEAVTKRYSADDVAVTELSLTIPSGELCVLVGPSGCAKTTTLRMINRLIEPSGGRILIDGTDVLAMDPVELRRGIGYVIRQGGLFPHRRVTDNVATVSRLLGWDKDRVDVRVHDLLELVGLLPGQYGRRFPHELSGGERQRVGPGDSLDDARAVAAAEGSGSQWAVVVDEDRLPGWIDLEPAVAGPVTDHVVPFDVEVPLGATLRSVLSEMPQHDQSWIPVVEQQRYLGVLTPDRLHAAMRRSVGGHLLD